MSAASQLPACDRCVPKLVLWILGFLCLLMLIFLLVLIVAIAVREKFVPTLPEVKLKSAPSVTVLNVSGDQVTSDWEIIFSVKNINHISMSYDRIHTIMLPENQQLVFSSSSPVSPFVQHGYEETDVAVRFEGLTMVVDGWANRNSGMVSLNLTLTATVGKYKRWTWPRKSWLRADCNELKIIFFMNSMGTAVGGSTDCNVKGGWVAIDDILGYTYVSCGALFVLVWFAAACLGSKYNVKGNEPKSIFAKLMFIP